MSYLLIIRSEAERDMSEARDWYNGQRAGGIRKPSIPVVNMTQPTFNTSELKQLLKEALAETLHEQRELLHEVFAEVLEDFGLAEVIREGQQTERVDRADVLEILERRT